MLPSATQRFRELAPSDAEKGKSYKQPLINISIVLEIELTTASFGVHMTA
jgi:hypothetical protein